MQNDGHALRALGDQMDNAQLTASGKFWQVCEAIERSEHPSADKRVLVGLVGRRCARLMFGVLLRDLTRTPGLFTTLVAALANGFVRETAEQLQAFPFSERLAAFNGLAQQLAQGLQLGFAEKVEAPPEPPASDARLAAAARLARLIKDHAHTEELSTHVEVSFATHDAAAILSAADTLLKALELPG